MRHFLWLLIFSAFPLSAVGITLIPYTGPSVRGVDTSTLTGKIVCGYQGWFNCEGDGADLGWVHRVKDRKKPMQDGNAKIDLWPDVSELSQSERYDTGCPS